MSPNNSSLPMRAHYNPFQFDLQAADISASQTFTARFDGFNDPCPTDFAMGQLAPDCKIYLMTGQASKYLHVIENPDGKGLDCGFKRRGIVLPHTGGAGMPLFPNYRLGPLDNPGVPCKSTVGASQASDKEIAVRISPNPAHDHLYIMLVPTIADQPARIDFVLTDALGRPVKTTVLGGIENEVPLMDISSGMYFWQIR